MSDDAAEMLLTTDEYLFRTFDEDTADRYYGLGLVYDPALGFLATVEQNRTSLKNELTTEEMAEIRRARSAISKAVNALEVAARRVQEDQDQGEDR